MRIASISARAPEWLHRLPDAVDDAKGALIEPFTCGYYAVMRHGGVNAADTVVVSGGGTIGLVTAAAAIGMGARVIVVDPVPLRREIAMKIGADATVDPMDGDPIEAVQEITKGGGDLVVECAGHDASLANVFQYARDEGCVSMVGINIGKKIPVELGKIQIKNLSVRGTIGSPGVWPAAIRFLEKDRDRPVTDPDPSFCPRRCRRGLRAWQTGRQGRQGHARDRLRTPVWGDE